MVKPELRIGVVYDFRNPLDSGMTHSALYGAILDQVQWLDGLGLDLVWFTGGTAETRRAPSPFLAVSLPPRANAHSSRNPAHAK
jgi:hypothetical protein